MPYITPAGQAISRPGGVGNTELTASEPAFIRQTCGGDTTARCGRLPGAYMCRHHRGRGNADIRSCALTPHRRVVGSSPTGAFCGRYDGASYLSRGDARALPGDAGGHGGDGRRRRGHRRTARRRARRDAPRPWTPAPPGLHTGPRTSTGDVPSVWPRPQSMRAQRAGRAASVRGHARRGRRRRSVRAGRAAGPAARRRGAYRPPRPPGGQLPARGPVVHGRRQGRAERAARPAGAGARRPALRRLPARRRPGRRARHGRAGRRRRRTASSTPSRRCAS